MASDTLERYKALAGPNPDLTLIHESMDDDTEMAGGNRGKFDREEREILAKWQLPGKLDSASAKRQLLVLIAELLTSFKQTIFIDHKKREWTFKEGDDEDKFAKEFGNAAVQLHPVKNKQNRVARWISITKMRTAESISDWKSHEYFYDQVIEAKTYLFPHPFPYDEWDITSIGFLKEIHTAHFNQDHLHWLIMEYIKAQDQNPPVFQLIPQKITNMEKTAVTRAYTVQCTKGNAKKMHELLTQGEFRATQMFIPFRYKRNQPEMFTKCIKQQNAVYFKTWVVKLEGLSKENMHFLIDTLKTIPGTYHVVPSKKYDEIGEWKLLVDRTKSPFIHRQLHENWEKLLSNIPQNFLDANPATWPPPRISSKKIRDYQDDSASNDSYGSLLTSGTNESASNYEYENLQDLPVEYQYPSYATVAAPAKSVTATAFSSPTTSELTEWQREKSELEALIKQQAALIEKFQSDQAKMLREIQDAQAKQIAQLKADQAQQIELLQADIQSKVSRSKDLEDNLAQAIELAYNRNAREDEMLKKFDLLMRQFPISTDTSDPHTPERNDQMIVYGKPHTTPPRTNTTKESPPPKKANNNSSPQRTNTMYQIFRPSSHRALRSSQQKKNTGQLLTQPMEEDEESQPTPMAAMGQLQE